MATERRLKLRASGIMKRSRVLVGELALQVEEIRAGDMPGLEGVPPGHRDIGNVAAFRLISDRSCNRTAEIGPMQDPRVPLS